MLANREKLLSAGQEVYFSYLALELANSYQEADEKKGSLTAQLNRAISEAYESPFEVYLGDETFICSLQIDGGSVEHPSYQLHFQNKSKLPDLNAIRNLKDYSHEEIQTILRCQDFRLHYDPLEQDYVFSIRLPGYDSVAGEIGGPDKLELYSEHIPSLGKILQRLAASPSDPENLATLIAMPMGSGKSFVQALWLLVLHKAGVGGIFAAPPQLVSQLHSDVLRLLPQEVATDILRVTDEPVEQIVFQEALEVDQQKRTLAIVDQNFILNECWRYFETDVLSASHYMVSFDEPHKITSEASVLRLNHLIKDKKFQALLLTATPTRLCFELSGGKATVATTNKERLEQGFAVASEYRLSTTQSTAEKAKHLPTWKHRWAQYFMDTALEMFDPERTTPAREMIPMMRYEFIAKDPGQGKFYQPKELTLAEYRNFLRWNTTVPCAQKVMIVAADGETVVNAALHLANPTTKFVYRDGSVRFSHEMPENDGEPSTEQIYQAHRRTQLLQKMADYSAKHGFKDKSFSEFAEQKLQHQDRVDQNGLGVHFCGIVDNALSALTGYDFLVLDSKRFDDLPGLWAEVQEKLALLDLTNAFACQQALCQKFERQGLPYAIAANLAALSYEIFCYLDNDAHSVELRQAIVDNWYFDANQNRGELFGARNIRVAPLTLIAGENFRYQSYEHREAQLRNKRVYSGFTYKRLPKPKLGQPKSLLEMLNAEETTEIYQPIEEYIDLETLKALFRHKLTTHVVTNSLDTGYNDLDLQVVINLTGFSGDANPEQMVQASGRNRGLSPERPPPAFLQICDQGVKPFLPLSALQDGDFVEPLLAGSEKFRIETLPIHAETMAKQIIAWVQSAINPDGTIDEEDLADYSIKLAQKILIQINQNQSFNLDKTKAEFCRFLEFLQTALQREAYSMSHPSEMSFKAKFCFSILAGIARWVYEWFFEKPATRKLALKVKTLLEKPDDEVNPDVKARIKLYQKIVAQKHKSFIQNQMTLMFSAALVSKDMHKIMGENDLSILLTEAGRSKVNEQASRLFCGLIGDAKEHQELRDKVEHCQTFWKVFLNKEFLDCISEFPLLLTLLDSHPDPEVVAFKNEVLAPVIPVVLQNFMVSGGMPVMPSFDAKSLAEDLDLRRSPQFPAISRMLHSKVLNDSMKNIFSPYTEAELALLIPGGNAVAQAKKVKDLLQDLDQLSESDFDQKYLSTFGKFDNFSAILQNTTQILTSLSECQGYFHGFDNHAQAVDAEHVPILIQETELADPALRVTGSGIVHELLSGIFIAKSAIDSLPVINHIQAQAKLHLSQTTQAVSDKWVREVRDGLTRGPGFFAQRVNSEEPLVRHAAATAGEIYKTKPLTLAEACDGKVHCFQELIENVNERMAPMSVA